MPNNYTNRSHHIGYQPIYDSSSWYNCSLLSAWVFRRALVKLFRYCLIHGSCIKSSLKYLKKQCYLCAEISLTLEQVTNQCTSDGKWRPSNIHLPCWASTARKIKKTFLRQYISLEYHPVQNSLGLLNWTVIFISIESNCFHMF